MRTRHDTNVRRTAVAGRFYSDDGSELGRHVARYLAEAKVPERGQPPLAIIAPHAGYVYSGPIAGSAYRGLVGAQFARVVLIGPAHYVAVEGIAALSSSSFASPLGLIPVDTAAITDLRDAGLVVMDDEAHAPEHSLEVQMPFLQGALAGDFSVIPLLVGRAGPALVEAVIRRVCASPERTLIVISSDLSHFETHAVARQMDLRTSAAIESLNPDAIGPADACGRVAIQGLLRVAKAEGWTPGTLDLRDSSDTAGDPGRVVGYGAWDFHRA